MRAIGFGSAIMLSMVGALGACDGEGPGTTVSISTQPLTLQGVEDACYTLEVRNDVGETVWSLGHVCATQYGDGVGSITYIGTCDATDNDGVDGAKNTVTLTLENLYTAPANPADYGVNAVDDGEWENPCSQYADGSEVDPNGDGHPACTQTFDCVENADVAAPFDITVVRSANQGFFDVLVDFEDVFCSAKVDCADELLFNPATSQRDETAVLAFACTAGENADTHLYLSDVYIACTKGFGFYNVTSLDPSAGFGNIGETASMEDGYGAGIGLGSDVTPGDVVVNDYAIYAGTEQLDPYNKAYWNIALQVNSKELFDPFLTGEGNPTTGRKCYLNAWGTASDGPLDDAATHPDAVSPYVHFMVPLNGGPVDNPSKTLDCTNNGLDDNETLSGVTTEYDGFSQILCFENELVPDFGDDNVTLSHYEQFNGPPIGNPSYSGGITCQFDWSAMPEEFGPNNSRPGEVTALVYFDANKNGTRDSGEAIHSQMNVGIQPAGPLSGTTFGTQTITAGSTTFTNVVAGSYVVTFQGPVEDASASWWSENGGPCVRAAHTIQVPNAGKYRTIGNTVPPEVVEFGFQCVDREQE